MKRAEGIVEILEAFDLTGSFREAAELAGWSHHTVARYVRLRAAGRTLTERAARDRLIDGFRLSAMTRPRVVDAFSHRVRVPSDQVAGDPAIGLKVWLKAHVIGSKGTQERGDVLRAGPSPEPLRNPSEVSVVLVCSLRFVRYSDRVQLAHHEVAELALSADPEPPLPLPGLHCR